MMCFYKLVSSANWMSEVHCKSQDWHHPNQLRAALMQTGGGWASAEALLQSLTYVKRYRWRRRKIFLVIISKCKYSWKKNSTIFLPWEKGLVRSGVLLENGLGYSDGWSPGELCTVPTLQINLGPVISEGAQSPSSLAFWSPGTPHRPPKFYHAAEKKERVAGWGGERV